MAAVKKPRYKTVDGFTIPEMMDPTCFREGLQYKPHPDDLFIVTFLKCGTTWTQAIVTLLLRKGEPLKTFAEFGGANPHLEMMGVEAVEAMKRPGAIKTHLPFHLQPYSPDAKYIYVARNPKDCCVSFYYHTRDFDGYDFADGTFDDFFELFIRGENEYGDYFAHTLSWHEHRNDPNVLFLTYEDMKKDTRGAVRQLAAFIGKEYADMLDDDPTLLDNVLHYSSFQYMKDEFNSAMGFLKNRMTDEEMDALPLPKGLKYAMKYTSKMGLLGKVSKDLNFVRKGIVGDWRNHFSPEQSKLVDERFSKILGHTDLADLWREHMEWRDL